MKEKQSKLEKSLSLLTKLEMKAFAQWLKSPWCNSNKKVEQLFRYMRPYYPDFSSPLLQREQLFASLYPDKAFNDRWMRNLQAELNKQVERFLIHQELEQAPNWSQLLLAKIYERKHASQRLFKLSESWQKSLQNKTNKSWEDYLFLCLSNDQLYYLPETTNRWQAEQHPLSKADHFLDQFYVLGKWRYRSELVERSHFLKEKNESLIELAVLDKIGQHSTIPAIDLYRKKLLESTDLDEQQFEQLYQNYWNALDQLSFKDQKIFYYYLLNMLIRMALRGKSDLFVRVFDLYEQGIKKDWIIHHGRISDMTFTNIVTLGNSLEKFDYVDDFIQRHSNLLKTDKQVDAKLWARAHWHFNQQHFEKVIDLLWPHKFRIPIFAWQGRSLLFESYFEAACQHPSYFLLFYDYSQAFKKFCERDKNLSPERKKAYLLFIRYTVKLAQLVEHKKTEKYHFDQLMQEIDSESIIQAKPWLRKTIEKQKSGAG